MVELVPCCLAHDLPRAISLITGLIVIARLDWSIGRAIGKRLLASHPRLVIQTQLRTQWWLVFVLKDDLFFDWISFPFPCYFWIIIRLTFSDCSDKQHRRLKDKEKKMVTYRTVDHLLLYRVWHWKADQYLDDIVSTMRVKFHGIDLYALIVFLFLFNCTIAFSPFIPLPIPSPSYSCLNVSVNSISFGRIHSLNFFAGQSQPPNVSCSWTINNSLASGGSNYLLSLRVLELENDPTHWSNELSFWTGNRQISVDEINKRSFLLPTASSSLEIFFRTKAPLLQTFNPYIRTNLRVRRFLIEFIHLNNELTAHDNSDEKYFRCQSSGMVIPKQWRCNCIYECLDDDHSDEENCPLCSMYEPSNSLICQSNEIWCLPKPWKPLRENLIEDESEEDNWMEAHLSYSRRIDPKGEQRQCEDDWPPSILSGVCVPRGDHQRCLYSTNTSFCQTVLAWRQDHGQILLDNVTLHNSQTLCFVIIAKEEYKIKLLLNQYQIFNEHPDLEWMIYDGSEAQDQLLLASNRLRTKETIQTRRSHIATVIIRQRSVPEIVNTDHVDEDVLGHLDTNDTRAIARRRRASNAILLNITWITSICPDDQMLCGGHFEVKCYTAEQRCDGQCALFDSHSLSSWRFAFLH